jgi:hypothetical protein
MRSFLKGVPLAWGPSKLMKTGEMGTTPTGWLACPLLYSRGSVFKSASSLATEPLMGLQKGLSGSRVRNA